MTSVEVTQRHLDRIAEVDGQVHAFLHVDAEGALEQAAASDARRANGQARSPLDGVPIAVKDVMATKGLPTTCGSRILEGWVPPYDATVVARLREAGLPILGKTNMDEFAMGSSTEHSAYGPTRNPWDLDRIPGGSGGGSAAAVAAYEAPLAIGTDTGGSIRQPGAVTGTVGVKPTYGGVSRYGLVSLANSLDQAGPVTRTVLDAALLHEVIGGHDPKDSTSIDAPLPDLVGAVRRGRRGRPERRAHRRGQGARRRGVPGRRAGPLPGVGRPDGRGRRPAGRGLVPELRARARDLLPDPPGRGVQQPGPLRRDALRAAEVPRGRRRTERRGGDAGDPRGRLRRRGEAPHHPGHLRAVERLLRRLLRPGAEGAHADQPGLRGRLRARRRAALAHGADDGVRARREDRRPARDVPQRPGHHPRQPLRRPRHLGAERPRRRGRPARRRADPGAGDGRRPGVLRRCRPRGGADRQVGRPAARPGPWAREGSDRHDRPDDRADVVRRGARALRPRPRSRGARRAQHRLEDVLRLPDGVRRRAQHADLPDLPGAARARCRSSTRSRSSRRSGSGWRSTARSPSGAGSRGRTTSTRTCRRTSRPRSTTSRSPSRAGPTSSSRAPTARRRCASTSSARTWRRTPASRCTSAARPAGSTAPTTRWSTTTAPASRSSRSSPSRSSAPARSCRWSPRRTSRSCGTCCSASA